MTIERVRIIPGPTLNDIDVSLIDSDGTEHTLDIEAISWQIEQGKPPTKAAFLLSLTPVDPDANPLETDLFDVVQPDPVDQGGPS